MISNRGEEMYQFIKTLYPICRSITGDGFRQTLGFIAKEIPLKRFEIPSGEGVFDWTVPKEWNIRDGWIKNSAGEKVVDFKKHNLHVLNYSAPIHRKMTLDELKPHLFTLPENPDWIPYRTSYYNENWGFCMSENQLREMPPGEYEVFIDSTLENGSLTYAECFLQGESDEEMLISCHACHPSLCNDNLSGIAVATWLGKHLKNRARRLSYRIIFIPGTIGAITWLAKNEAHVKKIKHGLVVTGVGDGGHVTYKRSRRGNAEIDKAFEYVLKNSGDKFDMIDFSPYGYDERQYCSPGFNLPMGCLMRTPFGQYPEYHTSADNLDFVKPVSLEDSLKKCVEVVEILESNATFKNTNPKCEPQLGKRGIYEAMGAPGTRQELQLAMLWTLNLSDSEHSLLDVAKRSKISFQTVVAAAKLLHEHQLLTKV